MVKITAPYNFVPLNRRVYIPEWGDQVSMDIPFEDGEDGYIEVVWRNDSPLCIRDARGHHKGEGKPYYSMHIDTPDGKLYYIPGSSLRGMLRNTLNIMTFGKMTQYMNRAFGYRVFKQGNEKRYLERMAGGGYGWLQSNSDDDYVLYPCVGKVDTITIEEVEKHFGINLDKYKSAWERNKAIQKEEGVCPEYEKDGVAYAIVMTGHINGKKKELLIPIEKKCPEKVPGSVIDKFFTIYESTPGFENYRRLLRSKRLIPVHYFMNDGQVDVVGMGKMIRYPYDYDIDTAVNNGQNKAMYNDKRDFTDAIFGWVADKNALRGRVQIGNAFASRPLADSELCEKVSGVLGQPKASFYPFYLKQGENGCQTYNDSGCCISGRKVYCIHKGRSVMPLPGNENNTKVESSMFPVPAGMEFKMRVNVHNLRKVEIGALLSAITLHRTDGVWHSIGSARSFGYGKLACANVILRGLEHKEEDYLKAFETEMDMFVQETEGNCWYVSESIRRLMAIKSENHPDDMLTMMKVDDYTKAKRTNFELDSRRNEQVNAKTYLSVEEHTYCQQEGAEKAKLQRYFPDLLNERTKVKNDWEDGRLNEALKGINGILGKFEELGIGYQKEDLNLKEAISESINQQECVKKDNEQKEKVQKLEAGLAKVLDEIYQEGPSKGKNKVANWKVCNQKVETWLKRKKEIYEDGTLNANECKELIATIRRLAKTPDKKEMKKNWWAKADSCLWTQVKAYLGEEVANQLYKEVNQ